MVLWLWAAVGVLALAAAAMYVKLRLMQRAADEIRLAFARRLAEDTNTLIGIPGRDGHMLALAADINVQLRELRRQRQRYEQGDAELREAITNASHDLRTPLTAICGYVQLLEREEKSPAAARYLALIDGRARDMRRLTEELLSYSVAATAREEALAPVCLNDALEESLAAAWAELSQRGITPEISLPAARIVRVTGRGSLGRIFGNILSNAAKYSGGDLRVVMDENGAVEFSNSAPGLSPVLAGRLFDRFYTVETGSSSTGLGLAIARLLTEKLGGGISARWSDGRLTIRLEL